MKQLLSILPAALLGCISVEDAITKHGKDVEPHLESLSEIEKKLASLPLLEADTLKAPGDLVLDARDSPGDDANTAIVYLEDLAELGALGNVYARLDASKLVPECASFVQHRTYPWNPRVPKAWETAVSGFIVEDQLERCARLRYVLVIRTTEITRASNARIDDGKVPFEAKNYGECETEGRCKFDGGRFAGEAHLFVLHPVEHRGGVRFSAESSEKKKFDHIVSSDEFLESDLEAAVGDALNRLEALASATRRGLAP